MHWYSCYCSAVEFLAFQFIYVFYAIYINTTRAKNEKCHIHCLSLYLTTFVCAPVNPILAEATDIVRSDHHDYIQQTIQRPYNKSMLCDLYK